MSAPQFNTWQSVQDEVLRRIHAREWPPGSAIPHEADLAVEFGCARTTVNRALRAVAEAGLLDRRRKAGTRVALHPVRKATLSITIIRAEIEGLGMAYAYRRILAETVKAPAPVQRRLGIRNDPMLHVRALHLADATPYVLEERWVRIASVPTIMEADLTQQSANEWLVANAPFTHGDIAFSASAASEAEATFLACAPGAALFVIARTTWNGAAPITSVRLTYAPGYRMVTEL